MSAVLGTLESGTALAASERRSGPLLAVIVPTFREVGNVEELVRRLDAALNGISWEVVFVDDDSPDGTAELVRSISQIDSRVRCVLRIGRRGLSSACVEGVLATSAPFVAVMDADLQHDEGILPEMLRQLSDENLDIVVGSRYAPGGSVGDWKGERAAMSRFATKLSRLVVRADLKDPMSGFFMVRRDVFMKATRRLSSVGFKILLDIFASSPAPLKFREVPFQFRTRFAGESKLDSVAMWDYGMLLLDKLVGHIVPVRFVMFSIVGFFGLGVHLLVLGTLVNAALVSFEAAQTAAAITAMTANFLLNNYLTYRDKRLKGLRMIQGLLIFYAVCGLGAVANVGVAGYVFEHNYSWWLSGIAGVLIGAVWNYVVSSLFTWRNT
jgi:dolichol-phosphate mannosyltransferase